MFKILLFVTVLVFTFPTAAEDTDWQSVPEFDPSNVTLSPVYLENPRFPGLSEAEKADFLQVVSALAKQHFGITVNFEPLENAPIERYFAPLADAIPDARTSLIADFRNGDVDWRRMAESIWPYVYDAPDTVREYALPYLLVPSPDGAPKLLTVALTQTMQLRAEYWRTAKAEDEYLVVGDAPSLPPLPYNEWIYWDYLGEIDFPYDTVITNQPVISVEYDAIPPHAALRGGITAGTTSTSVHAKYGAFSWASMYPFLSDDEAVTHLRGGETYSRADAVKFAAALYVHELGHHLFRFGHPWDNPNCVMYPVMLLQFKSWFETLDPQKCAIGSSEAMKPGHVRIRKPGQFAK